MASVSVKNWSFWGFIIHGWHTCRKWGLNLDFVIYSLIQENSKLLILSNNESMRLSYYKKLMICYSVAYNSLNKLWKQFAEIAYMRGCQMRICLLSCLQHLSSTGNTQVSTSFIHVIFFINKQVNICFFEIDRNNTICLTLTKSITK